jgi:hypothetical protein
MSDQYPKWKYNRKLGGKIVHNAEEEKALGDSWYDDPRESVDTSKSMFLEKREKPRWGRWAWIVVGIATMLAVIGGVIKLWR